MGVGKQKNCKYEFPRISHEFSCLVFSTSAVKVSRSSSSVELRAYTFAVKGFYTKQSSNVVNHVTGIGNCEEIPKYILTKLRILQVYIKI